MPLPCLALGIVLLAAPLLTAADSDVSITPIRLGKPMISVTAPAGGKPDARTAAALRGRMTVRWEDLTLAEVGDHLHRLAGLNVVVDPRVADRVVHITLTNTRVGSVVEWVALQAGVYRRFMGEAVFFTPDKRSGKQVTRYYEVADLTEPLRSFPGPTLKLDPSGQTSGLIPQSEEEPEQVTGLDELADILNDHVGR